MTQPTEPMSGRRTRVERMRMPLARCRQAVAVDHGVCIRPVPVRRVDTHTGDAQIVDVPCGATLAAVCPSCAERKRRLRLAQCREGWHLEDKPVLDPDPPTGEQKYWATLRADAQKMRDTAADAGGGHDRPGHPPRRTRRGTHPLRDPGQGRARVGASSPGPVHQAAARRPGSAAPGGGAAHVRIPETALREFVESGLVEPVTVRNHRGRRVA